MIYTFFKEDLYSLAHVTGWEPYDLHDLAFFFCHVQVLDPCSTSADPERYLVTTAIGSTVHLGPGGYFWGLLGRGGVGARGHSLE